MSQIKSNTTSLQSILETINNLPEVGGGFGVTEEQLAQIEQNKNDISQLSDDVVDLYKKKANVIINTLSGESIAISDSAEVKLENLRVLGKSEQDINMSISKNLCKIIIADQTVQNGITFTVNDDKSITLNGTCTADSYVNIGTALLEAGIEYAINGCPITDGNVIAFYANYAPSSGNVWNRGYESKFILAETVSCRCTMQILKGAVLTNITVYPMIRLASNLNSTYEPYDDSLDREDIHEIRSVGDNGAVVVSINNQKFSVSTPNGLSGIKVTNAAIANYTDANGQMWVVDEIDLERGVYVQRIYEQNLPIAMVTKDSSTNRFLIQTSLLDKTPLLGDNMVGSVLSDKFLGSINQDAGNNRISLDPSGYVNIGYDASKTTQDFINEFTNDPIKILYILKNPIETPIPTEEIEAYKAINTNYSNIIICNDSGAILEASYVADTKKYIDNKINEFGYNIEPMENDIPKVFINGSIPLTKTEVLAELDYISKTETFHTYIKIKCQGNSSLEHSKKNFTIKMYSDEPREIELKKTFKDWKYAQNKYVLKANFVDHSHSRNIVCARLWDEVVASRSDYDLLPTELKESPKNGAIDGFPIKFYENGVYQGIYTWNIGKDDWMWGLDKDNPNHALICATTNSDFTREATPCNFRTLWSGIDKEYWDIEVGDNTEAIKNSLNALITCVKDTDNETFKATIENHLDLQSAIDYWIHQYVTCGLDGLAKNMLLGTYDMEKWIMGAYDMEGTFGLFWNGSKFVSAEYRCPEDYQENYSLLFERISELYSERIKERYKELRKTVYSISNIVTHFERLTDTIGKDLYAEDLEIYVTIPNGDTNNIKQIRTYIRDRLTYVDLQFLQ